MRQKRSCMRITGGTGDIFMGFLLLDYDVLDVYKNGQNGRCSDEEIRWLNGFKSKYEAIRRPERGI